MNAGIVYHLQVFPLNFMGDAAKWKVREWL